MTHKSLNAEALQQQQRSQVLFRRLGLSASPETAPAMRLSQPSPRPICFGQQPPTTRAISAGMYEVSRAHQIAF